MIDGEDDLDAAAGEGAGSPQRWWSPYRLRERSRARPEFKRLVERATFGDPMRPLIWASKSMETQMGQPISADSVRRELMKLGFSRQSNRKADEGSKHPDRNAQSSMPTSLQRRPRSSPSSPSTPIHTYVGPMTDKSITDRVKRFDEIKSDFKGRQEMVRALAATGLPTPDRISRPPLQGAVRDLAEVPRPLHEERAGPCRQEWVPGRLSLNRHRRRPGDPEAASAQWRAVADQIRPKVPKLAAIMNDAEPDVLAYMTFPRGTASSSTHQPGRAPQREIKRRTEVVALSRAAS